MHKLVHKCSFVNSSYFLNFSSRKIFARQIFVPAVNLASFCEG